jgi:hypothetical protein
VQDFHTDDVMSLHKEDLIAILAWRFGLVPAAMYKYIDSIDDREVLDHLLSAARNTSTWGEFVGQFRREVAGEQSKSRDMKVVT